MKLTAKKCESARREKDGTKLFDGAGLFLFLHTNGRKYWRYKYNHPVTKKEKLLSLGVYPEISLAEARDKHRDAHKMVMEGIDPSFAQKEEKRLQKLSAENTFKMIALEWHEHMLDQWTPGHARTIKQRLEKDLFATIGNYPIKDINAPILLAALREIEKRGAPEVARRMLQTSGAVFRYAIVTGRAERDISIDLKGALKPFKRDHYHALDYRELPGFLEKLHRNDARMFIPTKLAVELLMLTFVRTSELIKAQWNEFDFDEKMWIIPAKRMKMRKDHLVPLSDRSCEILQELRQMNEHWDWVFPSKQNPRNHMSNNAILSALKRMGYAGQHTGHGFRALAMSTIKEKLGYRHEVIDRQLAHAPKKQVDKAYDRAEFLDERKKMMQDWANYIDQVRSKT